MSGLQQGRVFNVMESLSLTFLAVQDCYLVLRGKPVFCFSSCNSITEHTQCDIANQPLFLPSNVTLSIHARKQILIFETNRNLKMVKKIQIN